MQQAVLGQNEDDGFLEGGLEGKAGNSITLQNYRAIEAAYAKEFMRAAESQLPSANQITYLQQVRFVGHRGRGGGGIGLRQVLLTSWSRVA